MHCLNWNRIKLTTIQFEFSSLDHFSQFTILHSSCVVGTFIQIAHKLRSDLVEPSEAILIEYIDFNFLHNAKKGQFNFYAINFDRNATNEKSSPISNINNTNTHQVMYFFGY